MKVLIVLCALAAVSMAKPGYLAGGIAAPGLIGAVRAVPAADVIPAGLAGLTPQGVPVDTPAVQAARAANAVAHLNANSLTLGAHTVGLAAPGLIGAPALGLAAPGLIGAVRAVPAADVIPAGLAGLTPLGVPVDTPAVQAAKAANAVAHLNANSLTLGAHTLGLAAPGLIGAPALGLAAPGFIGAPALRYAAHAVSAVPAADVIPAGLAGLTPQGVPVDTPAVQAARAANAVAHLNANSLIFGAYNLGFAAPGFIGAPALRYAAHAVSAVPAADVVPAGLVLTPQGVPVDTPAVQAARAADAVAHLNAKSLILG